MTARVCTICARGGSKGVPGKNIKLLNGLPLIAHSIRHARESGLFDIVAVSSDSDEILGVAKQHGADMVIKRPAELATDESGKVPAIVHAIRAVEQETGNIYATCVDLDATSPLRLAQDIVESVKLLEESKASSVITGAPAHRSPYFNLVEADANGFVHVSKQLPGGVLRRQDSPKCYDMNASIYVWNRDVFLANPAVFYGDTRIHVMPRERSLDIDEALDFELVEMMMKRRNSA